MNKMNFKKDLGNQNRAKFIHDVKKLLDIDVNFIDDKYLNKNPYRIYVKIDMVGRNALLEYCTRKGYHIEHHWGDNVWISFDRDKMRKWYADFNSDYHRNMHLFYNEADEQ